MICLRSVVSVSIFWDEATLEIAAMSANVKTARFITHLIPRRDPGDLSPKSPGVWGLIGFDNGHKTPCGELWPLLSFWEKACIATCGRFQHGLGGLGFLFLIADVDLDRQTCLGRTEGICYPQPGTPSRNQNLHHFSKRFPNE